MPVNPHVQESKESLTTLPTNRAPETNPDPETLARQIRKHSGLIYGTCMRVLKNPHDAQDVTQECVVEYARKADRITTSVPGWLHSLATRRSIDFIRRQTTRRHCEQQAAETNHPDHTDSVHSWTELSTHLDEAIDSLSPEYQEPLLLHYFQGNSQADLAITLNVDQSTISRRLKKAVSELRNKLEGVGIVTTAISLTGLLSTNAHTGAPASVTTSVTKAALDAVGASLPSAGLLSIKTIFGIAAVAATTTTIIMSVIFSKSPESTQSPLAAYEEPPMASQPDPVAPTATPISTPGSESRKKIDWIPPSRPEWHKGWINGYARGIQLIAGYLDHQQEDYDTILGDLGVSFMMPADLNGTPEHNDVGWWPLEALGSQRLDFLSSTIGYKLTWHFLQSENESYIAQFKADFEPLVVQSLDQGKPCLQYFCGSESGGPWWCIVTDYDQAKTQFTGACSNNTGKPKLSSNGVDGLPSWLVTFGEPMEKLSRVEADKEALRYAIALHQDRALQTAGPEPLSWRTGVEGWACWASWLRHLEWQKTEFQYANHNTRNHLVTNRSSAIRFLKKMRTRHSDQAASELTLAAETYERVVDAVESLDLHLIKNSEGRMELATQIEEIIPLEAEAISHLQNAFHHMP